MISRQTVLVGDVVLAQLCLQTVYGLLFDHRYHHEALANHHKSDSPARHQSAINALAQHCLDAACLRHESSGRTSLQSPVYFGCFCVPLKCLCSSSFSPFTPSISTGNAPLFLTYALAAVTASRASSTPATAGASWRLVGCASRLLAAACVGGDSSRHLSRLANALVPLVPGRFSHTGELFPVEPQSSGLPGAPEATFQVPVAATDALLLLCACPLTLAHVAAEVKCVRGCTARLCERYRSAGEGPAGQDGRCQVLQLAACLALSDSCQQALLDAGVARRNEAYSGMCDLVALISQHVQLTNTPSTPAHHNRVIINDAMLRMLSICGQHACAALTAFQATNQHQRQP